MDRREALTRRLHTQLLWSPSGFSPSEVVGHFLAMQAQEYVPSQWSISQRISGAPDAGALAASIDHGEILRTHVLRPTWHYLTPADARWLLELTGPRIRKQLAAQYRTLGMADADLDRATRVVADRVATGEHLVRAELGSALADAGLPHTGIALGDAIMAAELDRLVISGVSRGKQRSYAAFDSRVPAATAPFDRELALADLAARYLRARGPATPRDLALWSGHTLTDARTAIRLASEREPGGFAEVTIGELRHWMPATAYDSAVQALRKPRVDLLQAYDEYVMGYTETRGYFTAEGMAPPGVPVRLPHHLFIDGLLRGSWGHSIGPSSATVTVRPAGRLSSSESTAVERAMLRYAKFLGLPTQLNWEPSSN